MSASLGAMHVPEGPPLVSEDCQSQLNAEGVPCLQENNCDLAGRRVARTGRTRSFECSVIIGRRLPSRTAYKHF